MRYNFFFGLILIMAFCNNVSRAQYKTPTPVPPDVTSFSKMVNYSVNLSTGVPDISIPIYTLEVGNMQLPIALRYHAGGFKINEQSGTVGLGWDITTNIQISRTINGRDDFDAQNLGYQNSAIIEPYSSEIYVPGENMPLTTRQQYSLAIGEIDGKPDKFNYRLLNKSGSFYILRDGSGYSFVTVPLDNIQISYNNDQFKIIDTDGVTYYFGQKVLDPTDDAAAGKERVGNIAVDGTCNNCKIVTWKSMKIVNGSGTDSIEFNYVNKSKKSVRTSNDFFEYYNNPNPCSPATNVQYPNSTIVNSAASFSSLMSQIRFSSLSSPKYLEYKDSRPYKFHMIWENAAQGNQLQDKSFDLINAGMSEARSSFSEVKGIALSSIKYRGGKIVFHGSDVLEAISIMNDNEELKRASFYYSIQGPNNLNDNMADAKYWNGQDFIGTSYLDSVVIGGGGSNYERYGFLYNKKTCFGAHLKGSDAWGGMNSITNDKSNFISPVFASQEINQQYYPACNTGTNVSHAIAVKINGGTMEYPDNNSSNGVLSRIIYPMGGYTDFDFEPNRFSLPFTDPISQSLWTRPLNGGGIRIKTITYYEGGNATTPIKQQYFTYGEYENGEGTLLNPPPFQVLNGKPIFGNYKFSQNVYYINSTQVISPAWEKWPAIVDPCSYASCVNVNAMETKTTYLPFSALNLTYSNGSPIFYSKVTEYQQDYGKNTGKTVYRYYPIAEFITPPIFPTQTGLLSNTDEEILQESWYFNKQKSVETFKMIKGKFVLAYKKEFNYKLNIKPKWPRVYHSFFRNFFNAAEYSTSWGIHNLYFDERNAMTGLYVAGPDFDVATYGIPVGNLLLSKESEEWHDTLSNNPIIKVVKEYRYDNPNYYQPTKIVEYNSKLGYKAKSLKYTYDYPYDPVLAGMVSKNIIQPIIEEIISENDTEELFRKQNKYAFVNNQFYALSSSLSSTSGKPLTIDQTFDVYDRYANLLSTTLRGGITSSYFYGYKAKYPVAEIIGVPYSTLLNAGLNQLILDEPASTSQLFTETNKLRALGVPNSIVRTFAFKPMVGLLESADENNRKIYYEYDGYNRLKAITDDQNNIVKTFEYKYSSIQPSILSNRSYTNKPAMQMVCNCYQEPAPSGYANNYLVKGGSVYSSISSYHADDVAVNQVSSIVGNGSPSTFCENDLNNNAALIRFYTLMSNQPLGLRPNNIQVDFFQGESLYGTIRFPNVDYFMKYVYLPEGEYKIGVNYDLSPAGFGLHFYLSGSDGSQYKLRNGDSILIKKKVNYVLIGDTEH